MPTLKKKHNFENCKRKYETWQLKKDQIKSRQTRKVICLDAPNRPLAKVLDQCHQFLQYFILKKQKELLLNSIGINSLTLEYKMSMLVGRVLKILL